MKIDDLVIYVYKNRIRIGRCVHKIDGDYVIQTKTGTYVRRKPKEEQAISVSLLFEKYKRELERGK